MKKFLIVFLLASILHIFQISILPSGLYWDELDTGYQAYSLLMTGRDYFGNVFPGHLQAFADYRSSLYMIATVPLVKLLGMTPLSIRMVSSVSFLISVILVYWLSAKWLKLGKYSWVSSLVFAFAPWGLVQGRMAAESILMLMLTLAGLAMFVKRKMALSAVFFALTLWSYGTAKLFLPVFLVALWLIHRKSIRVSQLFTPLVIFTLIAAIPLYETFSKPVGRRMTEVSVFTDPTVTFAVNYSRQQAALGSGKEFKLGLTPSLLDRFMINKPGVWLNTIVGNYSSAISTDFLFRSGDPNIRHNIKHTNTGQFYLVDLIPFIIGLALLILGRKDNRAVLLLCWLFLAPLPSVITRDGGSHAPRLLFLFPAVAFVISLGLAKLMRHKVAAAIYSLVLALSISASLFYFFTTYRVQSAYAFNTGFLEASSKAISERKNYSQVILDMHNENALMAYLISSRFNPSVFQASFPLPSKTIYTGIEGYIFDNVIILYPGTRDWNTIKLDGKSLVFVSTTQPNASDLSPLYSFRNPDSSPAIVAITR